MFRATFILSPELNPENNRYNITASYNIAPVAGATATDECFGFEVGGTSDDVVYVYTDGNFNLTSLNDPAAVFGENDGAVNNMCLTDEVLSVGAYVTRDHHPLLAGGSIASFGPINDPALFSSFARSCPPERFFPTSAPLALRLFLLSHRRISIIIRKSSAKKHPPRLQLMGRSIIT